MKKFTMAALACAITFTAPVFANDAHHPEGAASAPSTAPAAPAAKVSKTKANKAPKSEPSSMMDAKMKAMNEMHEKMMAAKTPEERSALMADHMKAMQGGMSMMGGMGATGKDKMEGGMPPDPAARQQMMEKRMDMMESMMQMMLDRMPAVPAK